MFQITLQFGGWDGVIDFYKVASRRISNCRGMFQTMAGSHGERKNSSTPAIADRELQIAKLP